MLLKIFCKKSWTVFLAGDNNDVPNPNPLTPKTFDDLLASPPPHFNRLKKYGNTFSW
jgi:hypothetical protein